MSDQADRYNAGKPDMSYLLEFYSSLSQFARVCTFGETKYSRGNYLKGLPLSNLMAAAIRHMGKFMQGFEEDEESGEHHLAHAVWNLLVALEQQSQEGYDRFDDRPCKPNPVEPCRLYEANYHDF